MNPRMKFWYSLVSVFVVLFGIMTTSIVYTNRVGAASQRAAREAVRRSQLQMCTILVPVSDIYNQPPPNEPKTEVGKQLAAKFAALVKQYDCPRS